ncbi:hypothetical protein O5D80_005558 [Batrachochytrium dendrobatidis]|nr:hypothetical protein O5D80_005558 [Batrachochytrium dendrobatidis]
MYKMDMGETGSYLDSDIDGVGAISQDATGTAEPAPLIANSPRWEETLNKIIPAIVSIRMICVRNFDTESQRTSQATGFIVDKKQGIILSNRHVVQPGPILADMILNQSKEEVRLTPIYRDPVHDFGFFKFDVSAVKYMKIQEIPLEPALVRVGLDIRVVGNDSGERLSILSGTMARLDRKAPNYGAGRFNDWNTFYYQAASMTSGGSSGSPVIDVDGNAIALNAGGATQSATSFFLPLDRVVRVLKLIQAGHSIPRGTIQTIFQYTAYDEIKRLGLDTDIETLVRQSFPENTGMLTVRQVIPKGPADKLLEAGDVLLRINDELITSFVPMEEIWDSNVGQSIKVLVQRGPDIKEVNITVQDLHSITPNRYLEVSGGILHELSYQMARSYIVPTGGVFVAGAGYMLGLSGVSKRCIIESLNNKPTPTLDAFIEVMGSLKDNERVSFRFHQLSDINKSKTSIILADRRWHDFKVAVRDDTTGLWNYTTLPPCSGEAVLEFHSATHLTLDDSLGPAKIVIPSLVHVAFYLPFKIDGVVAQIHTGVGVVLDAKCGLILVDRNTIPTSIGDILLTFSNSIIIPGKIIYLHQIFNFGIVSYDTSLLGDTFVRSVTISPKELSQADSVHLVCLSKSYQPIVRKTVVTNIRQFFVNEGVPPTYRAMNVEGIELENPVSQGGVLTTEDGQVQGFYAAYTKHGSKSSGEFYMGLSMSVVIPVLDALRTPDNIASMSGSNGVRHNLILPSMKTLEVEMTYTQVAHARIMGLTDAWVKRIESSHLSRRNVIVIRRVTSGTTASDLVNAGDIILSVNGKPATQFSDITSHYDQSHLELALLRDGKEMHVNTPLSTMLVSGTERVVGWAGAIFQMPHKAVYQQLNHVPSGVLCSVVYDGSPSQLYALHPLTWVTEVNGIPTPNLDEFLVQIMKVKKDTFVRLSTVSSTRFVKVIALRPNDHYFGMWEIVRDTSVASTWRLSSF